MQAIGNWTVGVSTWVRIAGEVDIDHHIYGDGQVELTIGGPDGLGLHITPQGLQTLVRELGAALAASRDVLGGGRQQGPAGLALVQADTP